MIKKLADRWAAYMIANGADAGQEEVYVYGFQCLANELVSDVILIALMLPLGKAKEMLIWILVFDVLRQKVGRYHAATPLKCQLQSISVGILSVLAQPVWERNGGLGTVSMLLACVIVFLLTATGWSGVI